MEEILNQILHELKDVKQDLNGLKQDIKDLKQGQDRLETKVDNLSLELRSNFKFTNDKLDEHKKVFDVVADEIKNVKGNIDYLSSKSGKHDMELNSIINKLRS